MNAARRDFEREILGMCAAEGMGIAPWGALGSGQLKSAKQREQGNAEGRKFGDATEKDIQVSSALEEIANAKSTAITRVALAYKPPVCLPRYRRA